MEFTDDPLVRYALNGDVPARSYDGGATWRQAYDWRGCENAAGVSTPKTNFYTGCGVEDTSCWWLSWLSSKGEVVEWEITDEGRLILRRSPRTGNNDRPEVFEWRNLDEETLPPLERILPDDVYQALEEEIQRQKEAMPPASGLGIDHLNTIPATYQDALKKATILMDRTLRWRRLCFLYEMGEREARKRCHASAKRNAELERRHQEDQQTLQRLQRRLRSLLKIPESFPTQEAGGKQIASEGSHGRLREEERLITPNDSFLETLHDKTPFIMDSAQTLLTGSVPAAKTQKLQRSIRHALDEMTELEPSKSRALTLIERLRKHRQTRPRYIVSSVRITGGP